MYAIVAEWLADKLEFAAGAQQHCPTPIRSQISLRRDGRSGGQNFAGKQGNADRIAVAALEMMKPIWRLAGFFGKTPPAEAHLNPVSISFQACSHPPPDV